MFPHAGKNDSSSLMAILNASMASNVATSVKQAEAKIEWNFVLGCDESIFCILQLLL